MATIRQKSFAGGELAPALYGRDDLAKYAVALKKCRNFYVTKQGTARMRPGTWYVANAKVTSPSGTRLIPFIFSDTQTYVLEVGHQYIRFHTQGAPIFSAGVPYEVATPYQAADLLQLKFAQTGNVLTITRRGYQPKELKRIADTNWTLTDVTFTRPACTCSPTIQEPFNAADATHVAREWAYQVTEIRRDTRGVTYESAPFNVVNATLDDSLVFQASQYYQGDDIRGAGLGTKAVSQGGADGGVSGTQYRCLVSGTGFLLSNTTHWVVDNVSQTPPRYQTDTLPATLVIYPDRPLILRIHVTDTNSLTITNPSFVAYRVYRGRGGLYGLVGDTRGATFTDVGQTPDYTIVPPQGTNPFLTYDSTGALIATEYPATVTFFEERRIFAGTSQRPGFVFASATADYANYDQRFIQTASQALLFEIASRKYEDIRSLVGLQRLLAFTGSAVWSIAGDNGALSGVGLIQARKQAEVGTNWVDPLILDGAALFIRAKGTGVRALVYDTLRDAYQGIDLSLLATHLFDGHQIVDWCYAEDPQGTIWAVRDDGVLLSLTYVRDQDIYAWATHDTAGIVTAICSVPEGIEDAVYIAVARSGVTYIEVFSKQSEALPIYAGETAIPFGGYNGTGYTTARTYMDCTRVAAVGNQVGIASVSSGPVDSALNGQSFGVVLSGTPSPATDPTYEGTFVAANGTVTFPVAAVNPNVIFYGLLMTAEIEGLDMAVQAAELKGRQKTIRRLGFEVSGSKGLLLGQDFNTLTEWLDRNVSDNYLSSPLLSGYFRTDVLGDWEQAAHFALRQTYPFPVTLLSVEREVEFGDD